MQSTKRVRKQATLFSPPQQVKKPKKRVQFADNAAGQQQQQQQVQRTVVHRSVPPDADEPAVAKAARNSAKPLRQSKHKTARAVVDNVEQAAANITSISDAALVHGATAAPADDPGSAICVAAAPIGGVGDTAGTAGATAVVAVRLQVVQQAIMAATAPVVAPAPVPAFPSAPADGGRGDSDTHVSVAVGGDARAVPMPAARASTMDMQAAFHRVQFQQQPEPQLSGPDGHDASAAFAPSPSPALGEPFGVPSVEERLEAPLPRLFQLGVNAAVNDPAAELEVDMVQRSFGDHVSSGAANRPVFDVRAEAEPALDGLFELGAMPSWGGDAPVAGYAEAEQERQLPLIELGVPQNGRPFTPPPVHVESAPDSSNLSGQLDRETVRAAGPRGISAASLSEQAAQMLQLRSALGISVSDGEVWVGQEALAQADVAKRAEMVLAMLSPEMLADLLTHGRAPGLPQDAREEQARNFMVRHWSAQKMQSVMRFLTFHYWYCADRGCVAYPAVPDVLQSVVAEYMLMAMHRAQLRNQQRKAEGKEVPASDQGGRKATKPVFLAAQSLATDLGLAFTITPAVKLAAKSPPSLPHVGELTPLAHLATFEMASRNDIDSVELSEFERAYSGGYSLQPSSGTRTMDQRRTAKLHFETSTVLGGEVVIVSGIARLTKGATALDMAPLEWRAPLVSMFYEEPPDLLPLIASMPDGDDGTMYRDFSVPPGAKHVITNATGWLNRPASHETVVESAKALLIKCGITEACAERHRGHAGRHVLPEIGRVLELSVQRRELLANHRVTPVFAEDAGDQQAYAKAVRIARQRVSRMGRLASCANRYASRHAEQVMSDESRLMCIAAVRDATMAWDNDPAVSKWGCTTREQIEDIRRRAGMPDVAGAGGSAASPKAKSKKRRRGQQ